MSRDNAALPHRLGGQNLTDETKTSRRRKAKEDAPVAAISNISDETIHGHLKAYEQQRKKLDDAQAAVNTERGVLRTVLKKAKSDGIDPAYITAAWALKKREPEDVDRETRFVTRIAVIWNIPIGGQLALGLFEDGTSAVTRIEQRIPVKSAHGDDFDSADAAEAGGYKSHGMGMALEENAYKDSGDQARIDAWARGWQRAQNDVAHLAGQALGGKAA